MGLLDLLGFGGGNISNKTIYRDNIINIPGNRFNREVRLSIDGKTLALSGEKLRDLLAGWAEGGITLSRLAQKLKSAGLDGAQYERRREIIKILERK